MDLSLGSLFCSIDLYFCLCASTILSWWLWLCSRAKVRQVDSSSSILLSQDALAIRGFLYFHTNCEIIWSSFTLLQVVDHFSQHHLLKRLSLVHCIFLPPLSKIRCPYVCGFISGLSILFHWSIFLFLCRFHTVLMTVAL